MGHRKAPRLHLTFRSHKEVDLIEMSAHRSGEKVVPWARKALLRQAKEQTARQVIEDKATFSMLEAVALLREMAGPEATARAIKHVQNYIDKVKGNVDTEFE